MNIVNFRRVHHSTKGAHVDEVFLPVVCGVNIVKLNLMLLQQQLIAEVFDYPATTTNWVRILKKVTKIKSFFIAKIHNFSNGF